PERPQRPSGQQNADQKRLENLSSSFRAVGLHDSFNVISVRLYEAIRFQVPSLIETAKAICVLPPFRDSLYTCGLCRRSPKRCRQWFTAASTTCATKL